MVFFFLRKYYLSLPCLSLEVMHAFFVSPKLYFVKFSMKNVVLYKEGRSSCLDLHCLLLNVYQMTWVHFCSFAITAVQRAFNSFLNKMLISKCS